MIPGTRIIAGALLLAGWIGFAGSALAAERVTLRNGFELDCSRQEPAGDRVRLYLADEGAAGASPKENYIEVKAGDIVRTEPLARAPGIEPAQPPAVSMSLPEATQPTPAEMRQMLIAAGARHNLDVDLLASVVRAESGGDTRAVSRAGAQGLMQLMPSTATGLGVANAFAADQNISGGTAYLDQLLTRYHDNLGLALAAYNAGPAAVDRYHGIPPYAETRAYVARVIREFNHRKRLEAAALSASVAAKQLP